MFPSKLISVLPGIDSLFFDSFAMHKKYFELNIVFFIPIMRKIPFFRVLENVVFVLFLFLLRFGAHKI